jgi:hypothetical protein
MFEDFEDEDVDVSPDSPDRAIVYAVWSRSDAASLTAEEAWAILHERYPDEPRFLLLEAYAELADGTPSASWTPGYFLTKLERIAGSGNEALHAPIRELLGFAGSVLAKATGEEATRLAGLRAQVGAEGPQPAKRDDRAGLRLRRFEREVVRELHERTEGGKPLGTRAATGSTIAPPAQNELEIALADRARTRKKYAADERYAKGELVEHPKFGVGVVTALEPGRVTLLFESGPRKLVAG